MALQVWNPLEVIPTVQLPSRSAADVTVSKAGLGAVQTGCDHNIV